MVAAAASVELTKGVDNKSYFCSVKMAAMTSHDEHILMLLGGS